MAAAFLSGCGSSRAPVNPASVPPDAPKAVDLVPPATPSGHATPAQPAKSLSERIAEAENSGKYPKLNRSSDITRPDANHNGVRDDIEAWINSLNVTDLQRKALMQDARATQQTLVVDLADKAAVERAGEGLMASAKCGASRFTPYAEFSKLGGKIEAMTANTRERAERYMQYNKASSGSVTALPNHDTCEP
jgi:hypothetical protein